MVPLRNSTLVAPALAAFARARSSISSVMSTPYAKPVGPDPAGRQQHVDAAARAEVEHPLPRRELRDRQRVAAAERRGDRLDGQAGDLGRVVERLTEALARRGAARPAATPVVRGLHCRQGVALADLLADVVHDVSSDIDACRCVDADSAPDIHGCQYRQPSISASYLPHASGPAARLDPRRVLHPRHELGDQRAGRRRSSPARSRRWRTRHGCGCCRSSRRTTARRPASATSSSPSA